MATENLANDSKCETDPVYRVSETDEAGGLEGPLILIEAADERNAIAQAKRMAVRKKKGLRLWADEKLILEIAKPAPRSVKSARSGN